MVGLERIGLERMQRRESKKRKADLMDDGVNTLTGSVSVADSQSNTVIPEGWKVGGGDSVNTLTGSVSVAGSQSNTVQDQLLVDLETDTLLSRSKKLIEKKRAISLEVNKKKFKFKTRGKLEKAEIEEIKRTHKKNIFSWVKEGQKKILEMDRFEMVTTSVDTDILMEMRDREAECYKEDRLNRVKARQKEFWTRKVGKEIVDDVLERVRIYRPTKSVEQMMEEVLEDVMEHSLVNNMFKEVVDTGPSAVIKLEHKMAD